MTFVRKQSDRSRCGLYCACKNGTSVIHDTKLSSNTVKLCLKQKILYI